MKLYERLKEYVLSLEFSANKCDSMGSRCPDCNGTQSDGHFDRCKLEALCEDIRTIKRAKELEED